MVVCGSRFEFIMSSRIERGLSTKFIDIGCLQGSYRRQHDYYLNCTENDRTLSVKCRIARSITAASHFEVTGISRVRVGRIASFVSLISSSGYFLLSCCVGVL